MNVLQDVIWEKENLLRNDTKQLQFVIINES